METHSAPPVGSLRAELYELRLLFRSIPSVVIVLFAMSVIAMNLLANKSIDLPVSWLALDGGILCSWICFLSMDILTRHFGPKAATQASILAVGVNLLACLFFFLASRIPGVWGEAWDNASAGTALDRTFGGTWYVLLGSTIAFLLSAVVNNFLNSAIGACFHRKPDGFLAYACRTYVSTAVGQFVDNLTFALLVSHLFFGWTLLQCITCAATGMLVELLCEILFSRFGYAICRRWQRDGVGKAYLDYRKERRA